MENSSKPKAAAAAAAATSDLAFAKCECCGLTEECTGEYIKRVRDRFSGQWICGLCSEAVKGSEKRIGNEEALNQHMSLCKKFKNPKGPTETDDELISAVQDPRLAPVKKQRCLILEG